MRYPSSALGHVIIGIVALDTLDLPETGDSGLIFSLRRVYLGRVFSRLVPYCKSRVQRTRKHVLY